MALVSYSSKLYFGYHTHKFSPNNPGGRTDALPFVGVPFSFRSSKSVACSLRIYAAAHPGLKATPPRRIAGADRFAKVSSSRDQQQSSSVGVNPINVPPPPSQIGSPLFWVTVGVALSAAFSWGASQLKKYAMQQAFKTVMGQMNTQSNQFSNVDYASGSPFVPLTPSAVHPSTSSAPVSSQSAFTVDASATKVEAASEIDKASQELKELKKIAFVDVSPEETIVRSPFQSFEDESQTSLLKDTQSPKDVSDNGAASYQGTAGDQGTPSMGKTSPGLSVDALEKMVEDPTVQKMVYPYLPEEMRNPETFKWMLQNPQYRQQLQDMLNNMGGSSEWDNRMMESLKNFDLNSPEVKQQFDQIGLTPQEVITKIMANPEIAIAFQNPKVQAAIMDCSQNPLSISKYQNDKEVMDVFSKISELFPGVTG